MQQYSAFHLGIHCLQKYPSRDFEYTKGLCLKYVLNLRCSLGFCLITLKIYKIRVFKLE